MKKDITYSLSSTVKSQLDFLAQALGTQSFFIQDTETTGIHEIDQIHDFAGLYYENGRVYQIQYYVVQPNDKDAEGRIHVDFNALRELNKGNAAFKFIMGTDKDSDKAYETMRKAMDKKTWDENDPMISRENLAKLLKTKYYKVPNFAYNAAFDINMERKLQQATGLNGKMVPGGVYDVLSMCADLMPDILEKDMGKDMGRIKLEKVYKYLDENYHNEFSPFKTGATKSQTHTAWDDVFSYTVPVLNFMVKTMKDRGYHINTYKDIQLIWKKAGMEGLQKARNNGQVIGMYIEDYMTDKKNKQPPKWLAGAIGSGQLEAVKALDTMSQMIIPEVSAVQAGIQQQISVSDAAQTKIEVELETEKADLRELKKQKAAMEKSLGKDPRQREASKRLTQQIKNKEKVINSLNTQKNKLTSNVDNLKKKLLKVNNDKKVLESGKEGPINDLKQAISQNNINIENAKVKIRDFLKQEFKKYHARVNTEWEWHGSTIKFRAQGKDIEIPAPEWWSKLRSEQVRLETLNKNLQTDLDHLLKTSLVMTPANQQKFKQYSQKIALAEKQISRLNRQIQIKSEALKRQQLTQDKLYTQKLEGLYKKLQGYALMRRGTAPMPPAYYRLLKQISSLEKKLVPYQQYDQRKANLEQKTKEIEFQQAKIQQLKADVEQVIQIRYKGKMVDVGITQNGHAAYFLTKQGTLGQKVPNTIWDVQKGMLRDDILYNMDSNEQFKRVTLQQIRKDPSLLKNMTAIPLKTGLNSDVYGFDDGTGHIVVARLHKSFFKDGSQAAQFGKEKIYSVSELGSVLSPYFGKESSESWSTDFGTAHHRILEEITKGRLAVHNHKISETELKQFLNKMWHSGKAEDKYDIKGIFDEYGRISDLSFKILQKTVNEGLEILHRAHIPLAEAKSEHTLGGRFIIGNVAVNVSGTLDLLWMSRGLAHVGDLKTSKQISPEYVVQLSLYRALVKLADPTTEVSKKLKIFLTPASGQKYGGLVEIDSMTDAELGAFIQAAVGVLEDKNPTTRAKKLQRIREQFIPKLEGHIGKTLVTKEVVVETDELEEVDENGKPLKKEIKAPRHFINGQSLGSVGKMLEKRFPLKGYEAQYRKAYADFKKKNPNSLTGFEDFLRMSLKRQDYNRHLKEVERRAKHVDEYLRTIKDPQTSNYIKRLLFLRGEGNTYLYGSDIFEDYRTSFLIHKSGNKLRNPVATDVYDILKKDPRHQNRFILNPKWLEQAKKDGIYTGTGVITLGGLTVRDWIDLFKNADLTELYKNPSKVKQIMLKAAESQNKAYSEAVNEVIKTFLYGEGSKTGLLEGNTDKSTMDEFYALQGFLNQINRIQQSIDNQYHLSQDKKFLPNLYKEYRKYLTTASNRAAAEHRKFKPIEFTDYVYKHTDNQTVKKFSAYRDLQAINKITTLTGVNKLYQVQQEHYEEHGYDFLNSSQLDLDKHLLREGYVEDVEDVFNAKQDENNTTFIEDYKPYEKEVFTTANRDTIIKQLPHRVARMLTRKQLGDIVYKSMYNDYLKNKGANTPAISYETFLTYLTPEQYSEYLSSSQLAKRFDQARKQHKLNSFLVDIAKGPTGIGADEESQNLYSLIKTIYEKEPSILTDPNILGEIAKQVTGAKMRYYQRFDTKTLAQLGLPLTLVGKKLDLTSKRSPYKTFVNTFGTGQANSKAGLGLISIFNTHKDWFDKGPEHFYKKLTSFMGGVHSDEEIKAQVDDIQQTLGPLLRSFSKYAPITDLIAEYSQVAKDYLDTRENLLKNQKKMRHQSSVNTVMITKSNQRMWEDIAHKKLAIGRTYYEEELYLLEDQYNYSQARKLYLNKCKEIAGYYDVFHYRALAWTVPGEQYKLINESTKVETLLRGREAAISRLNVEAEKVREFYDKQDDEEISKETAELHKRLAKEESVMAQNPNDLTVSLLQQILNQLKQNNGASANDTISAEDAKLASAITGRNTPIEEAQAMMEKRRAMGVKEMMSVEAKAYGQYLKARNKYEQARAKNAPDVKDLDKAQKYFNELYQEEVKRNNEAYAFTDKKLEDGRKKYMKEFDMTTGNSSLQKSYNTYVDNAFNILGSKRDLEGKLSKATDEGVRQMLQGKIADIDAKFQKALGKAIEFSDKYSSVDTQYLTDKQNQYNQKTDEELRNSREQDYVRGLEEEAELKKKILDLNIKLKSADPNSAQYRLLKSQKTQLNREKKAIHSENEGLYQILTEDGQTMLSDGSTIIAPDAYLRKGANYDRLSLKAAEQDAALKNYNSAKSTQLSLASQVKGAETALSKAKRAAEGSENEELQKQVDLLTRKVALLKEQYNIAKTATHDADTALRKAYGKRGGKQRLPQGYQSISEAEEMLDMDLQLGLSQEDYARYKQARMTYSTLKRQETTLKDQLYRNALKHDTSNNPNERTALEAQGGLLMIDFDENKKQLEEFERQYKDLKGFGDMKKELDEKFTDVQAKNIANANVAFKGENTLFGKLATSFRGMIYQFTQFGAAYKIIGTIKQSISQVIASAKNLDKAMTDLRIVTGQSGDEAQMTMSKFSDLASQLGVTTAEVAQSATAWLRQGYDMVQVNDLVTSSLYLSRLGMISVDEATKDLTSSLKGFKLEAQDALSVVDKLTALDVKAATTAGEIATGLAQFANLARLNGISIDQASAMVATIADVSQVSGAQAGNSLKMMLSRYGTVKSGKFDSMAEGEENTSLNDVEKVLNRIGVSIRDANLKFREFDDVLADISDKWDTLDNISQNAIATALAGTRQREAFLVLMSNMDKYRDFTEIAEGSEGTAIKKYVSYTEQLEASQKRVQAAFESFAQNADIAKFMTNVNNILEKAVKALPTIIKYVSRLLLTFNAYRIPTALNKAMKFMGVGAFGSNLTRRSGNNHYMGKSGNVISSEQFSALSDGDKKLYHRMTDYNEKASGGNPTYTAGIYNILKDIRAQVGAIAKQEVKEDGEGAKIQQTEEEKNRQMAKQNKKMTAMTVAIGTLSNTLMASTTSANWAKIGKSKNFKEWTQNMTNLQEASAEAQMTSKVVTGVSSLAGGFLGAVAGKNPQAAAIGTQVGGMFGDLLSKYVFMPWVDREHNARQERIATANKQLMNLSAVEGNIETLSNYSRLGLMTDEQFKEAKEASDAIVAKLYESESSETRSLLEKYLNKILNNQEEGNSRSLSLYEVMSSYMTGSKSDRERISKALAIASVQAKNEAEWNSLEQERKDLEWNMTHRDIGTSWGMNLGHLTGNGPVNIIESFLSKGWNGTLRNSNNGRFVVSDDAYNWQNNGRIAYDSFDQNGPTALANAYAKAGFTVKSGGKTTADKIGQALLKMISLGFADRQDYWVDSSDMTLTEQEEAFSKLYEDAVKNGNSELAKSAEDNLKQIKDINAKMDQMYDKMNEAYVQEAVLLARVGDRYISDMTTLELKDLGPDAILRAIGLYLVQQGKFAGHEVFEYGDHGELTGYAENLIMNELKGNSSIAGVMSGNAYTMSEIRNMAEGKTKTKMLTNLAMALGMSMEDVLDHYEELLQKYGDITLGTLLETPDEVRKHVTDLSNLIKQMATSSGLLAENIENIIKNYPELVKFLNDGHGMAAALITNVDQYRKVYAQNLYNELKSSQEYYEKEIIPLLKNNLSESEYSSFAKEMGNAHSIGDLVTWMGRGGSLASKVQELIAQATDMKVVAEIDQTIHDTVAKTYEKLLERQIENLEKQKSALQDINKQREYENKLIEAKLKLEDAQKEKKRVWREGVGWSYESDQTALAEAEKNLDAVKNEKKISELDLEIENLKAQKDYLSKLPEEKELQNMMNVYQAWTESQQAATDSVYELVKALDAWTAQNMVNFGLINQDVAGNKKNRASAEQDLRNLFENAYTDASGKTYSLSYLHEHRNDSAEMQRIYNEALNKYQSAYRTYNQQGLVDSTTFNNQDVSNADAWGGQASYFAANADQGNINNWSAVNPNFYYNVGKKGTLFKRGKNMFWSDEEWAKLLKNGYKKYRLVRFDPATGLAGPEITDQNWQEWKDGPQTLPSGMAIMDRKYNMLYVFHGGSAYEVNKLSAPNNLGPGFMPNKMYNSLIPADVAWLEKSGYKPDNNLGHYSRGTTGAKGGLALINEAGPEAIITPSGTITSLPSGSGVVPADVTRNVWQLGELAPAILRSLGYPNTISSGVGGPINNSDSVNIGTINMEVNADASFNAEKFVEALKQQASLNKNNRR